MPYVVVSDIHCHAWSLFERPTATGVNGRLKIVLDELERAADHAVSIGAKFIVDAGDTLHVRGAIPPEVLNPLQATIKRILDRGLDIHAIPGNHDLANKETDELGNAIKTLGETQSEHGRFVVHDKPGIVSIHGHSIGFVPWHSTTEGLLKDLAALSKSTNPATVDVFIHAGIDGVISGMPDKGLTAKILAGFGFRKVFAGHYHNFKAFDGEVYSIGATTHQKWNDVGSAAGFLVVDGDKVKHMASHAPAFVDVTGMNETDMKLAAKGNYVRFSAQDMSQAEIAEIKQMFADAGAAGVSILAPKKIVTARRPGTSTKAGASLADSVNAFVDNDPNISAAIDRNQVKIDALAILADVQTVKEEA